MFPILVLLLAAIPQALCNDDHPQFPRYFPIPRPSLPRLSRRCGTPHPPEVLSSNLQRLATDEPLDSNDLWSPQTFSERILSQPLHKRQSTPLIIIPLHYHIVSTNNASRSTDPLYTSDAQIQSQTTYLNNAFNPISVAFTLDSLDRTINPDWANGDDLDNMRRTLRNGTYRHLNIYIHSDLKSISNQTLLGVCSLPVLGVTPQTSPAAYAFDGCSILSRTVTDSRGGLTAYNLGGTAVHEVGHWFGLLHTFEGETCDANDWGDMVADTPQQKDATSVCPDPSKPPPDSCPVSGVAAGWNGVGGNPYGRQGYSGVDNYKNWMDYSPDRCYESFTAGQGARVVNAFNLWRRDR